MNSNRPYLSYNELLKHKFGEKVYKLTLDGGFTCPNRDGVKGRGGCTFCDDTGSSSRAQERGDSITEQLLKNIEQVRKRFKANKFVAYFQSYTNTYGKIDRLKRLYDEAVKEHTKHTKDMTLKVFIQINILIFRELFRE